LEGVDKVIFLRHDFPGFTFRIFPSRRENADAEAPSSARSAAIVAIERHLTKAFLVGPLIFCPLVLLSEKDITPDHHIVFDIIACTLQA